MPLSENPKCLSGLGLVFWRNEARIRFLMLLQVLKKWATILRLYTPGTLLRWIHTTRECRRSRFGHWPPESVHFELPACASSSHLSHPEYFACPLICHPGEKASQPELVLESVSRRSTTEYPGVATVEGYRSELLQVSERRRSTTEYPGVTVRGQIDRFWVGAVKCYR